MEVHIFILSTMNGEMTHQFLRENNLDFELSESIQRFRWSRSSANTGKTASLWCTTHEPLTSEMLPNIVPYMDACICLYHDHDALSCLQVRKAMDKLSAQNDHIWLMPTTIPNVDTKHKSRIKKFYNKSGFERPQIIGTLSHAIEEILNIDILNLNHLNGF